MAKKKKDFSVIINIVFVILFISVSVFLYSLFSKNHFETLKKDAKQVYKERTIVPVNPAENKQEEAKAELPPFTKYRFKYTYNVDIRGYLKTMDITMIIPHDENEKQYISDFSITPAPTKMYNDGVNNIAEYNLKDIEQHNFVIELQGLANVRTYNLDTAKKINKNHTPESDLSRYLQPEVLIESNDSSIVNAAKKIKGKTREEIVQKIYEFTQQNINYQVMQNIGAKRALQTKSGKCSEFAAVMIALCRAKNIPARLVVGNIARDKDTPHGWVEVYYDEYGWVMYDPTVMATNVTILDANGNVIKKEKRYEISGDTKYIISGRNMFNQLRIHFTTDARRNGTARVTETTEIQKAD